MGAFHLLYSLLISIIHLVGAPFFSAYHTASRTHTLLLHSRPLILYRGTHTYVAISVLSHSGQPHSTSTSSPPVKVTLVQQGWRSGLFGWTIAAYLGASASQGIDVTPSNTVGWDEPTTSASQDGDEEMDNLVKRDHAEQAKEDAAIDDGAAHKSSSSASKIAAEPPRLTSSQHSLYEKQLRSLHASLGSRSQVVSTHLIRIPVSAGDGYFKLAVQAPGSSKVLVQSPTIRIFSLSLSSASPRGASILPPTLAPELLLRLVSTILYTALLALFPVAAILEKILPRSWSRKFLRFLYRKTGMEQRKNDMLQKAGVEEKLQKAKETVHTTVPFAKAGVRTSYDLQRDAEAGKGGVTYVH